MAFKVSLNVPESLKQTPQLLNQAIQEGGQEVTTLVNNAAIDNAPRKFGTLKRSIHPEVNMSLGKFTGKVIQDSTVASYGEFVEEGTGVYHEPDARNAWTVTPKNTNALKFKVNGETIYRKKVSIQGMKARPYMKPALEENKEKIQQIMQSALQKVIGGK